MKTGEKPKKKKNGKRGLRFIAKKPTGKKRDDLMKTEQNEANSFKTKLSHLSNFTQSLIWSYFPIATLCLQI